jgi:hypothetical protein
MVDAFVSTARERSGVLGKAADLLIAIGLAVLVSSPSLAQSCNVVGNSICDNGLSGNRIGKPVSCCKFAASAITQSAGTTTRC